MTVAIKINDLSAHNGKIMSDLQEAAQRVLASGWYAMGPELEEFESNFASWCGASYCCGVANGTDALEIGLKSLGVEPGDEVITVANAGMYATTAILAIGATPVFADIDFPAMTISPRHVAELITTKTRAIIATHLYGKLCDMTALCALALQHRIPVLEDCAQAHGASLDGRKAGSWGEVAAFSFYPTKNLGALGDGGAVLCKCSEVFAKVKRLRQYGWQSKYEVVERGGRNSRLDELQAAFLNVKLKYIDQWLAQRRAVGKYFTENIGHEEVIVPELTSDHVFHLYVLRCKRRVEFRKYLQERGITTEIHFPLLDYQQPVFAKQPDKPCLENSEMALREIVTLPCYPELKQSEQARIIKVVNEW